MAQGMIYTFSDTVTVKRTISNLIQNIDPMEIKALSYFGTNNEKRFNILNFPNHKIEWLTDTYRVRTDAINQTGFTNSSTSLTVDDATKFKPYDVIRIEDELLLVTAVNTSTNVLTVTRGAGGTTAAAHDDNTTVTYEYSARMEGDDNDDYPFTTPANPYNYSQIFHGSISLSGSEMEATTRYGMPDPYKYQLMKLIGGAGGGGGRGGRAGDLLLDLENTFFQAQGRQQRTSSVPGIMGGFQYMVDTYGDSANAVDLSGATLQEDNVLDVMQEIWANGGKPTTLICGAHNKRVITSWYGDQVVTERSERTGGVRIDRIENDFGEVDIMLSRNIDDDKVFIADRSTCGFVTLRNWQIQPLAKTGDSRKDQVIGEFSFVMTTGKYNGYIYNTATS